MSNGTPDATSTIYYALDLDTDITYGFKLDAAGNCTALQQMTTIVKNKEGQISRAFEPIMDNAPFGQTVTAVEIGDSPNKHVFTMVWPSAADFANGARPAITKKDLPQDMVRAGIAPPPRLSLSSGYNKAVSPPPPVPKKVRDAELEQLFTKYCHDLTAEAKAGQLDPIVGRDAEVDQALKVMTRRKQSSLCFTGEAGVGKTAMFAAVAERIADGKNLPDSLKDARIMLLDLQEMGAGASHIGEFAGRLQPLIDGLTERQGMINGKKVIIAIDELASQLLSGGKGGGGDDAGSLMKIFLASQGISVMGTTTDEEYRKYIEKDPALVSRFEKLRVSPPDEASTLVILKKLWPLTKSYNHLTDDMTEEDMSYIVTMSNRYAPQEAQPRKGEKVMNMAASSAEFAHRTVINRDDIISAVSQMSGLTKDFLSQSDAERFLKMETELPKEILGQPGLKRITDGLIGAHSGLNDPNQPQGCFVLQGPTGTGKTETCKALARYLFGDETAIIKLDMSEYSEKHTVARLIGAPPGYIGFEDAEPALTERVRQRPYCILLLDEIEKAHPDVFNVLLPLINDGKMTDNKGKPVLFNNVIVVMTTNAGASEAQALIEGKSGMNFGTGDEQSPEKLQKSLEAVYEKARKFENGGPFRPEMINRIEELGGFITYVPLTQEVINQLTSREINKVNKRLGNADGANLPGVTLVVSDAVMQQLSKEGYNPAMGARPLRKVVREKIANPLGKWLMGHRDEITAFVAKEGQTKITINSLDNFAPVLVKTVPAVVNDNAATDKAALVTVNDNVATGDEAVPKKKRHAPKTPKPQI